MRILENKVALITGGYSGIGKASSILFAKEGATVIIAGRDEKKGEETIKGIKINSGNTIFIKADISKSSDVKNLMNNIINKFGKLDCAFNCAGIDGKKASLIDLNEEEWDEIIDTNLKGTFLLMKYEIEQMLKQGHGSIVNMASVCSFIVRPNRCAYNTSRHGIIGLTKSAALEYGSKGIKINAVAPGSIRTNLFYKSTNNDPAKQKLYAEAHPIGRIGEPEEVAEAALWLCSEKSSFVLGEVLTIDGGFKIQ